MLLTYWGEKKLEIITSHNALDFDGLASMVAAGKLYPAAVKVFSGTLSKNVKKFMALYKDLLMIKTPRELDLKQVSRMIIVDTANINRLGHLQEIAARSDMDFLIYDHHPVAFDDLRQGVREIHQVGAATTILVEEIMAQNIGISAFDATILALGIYEDTGSLLFTSTTPRDLTATAFLLGKGANLAVVANFMEQPFSGEQRQLLQVLLNHVQHYRINNLDVVVAVSETDEFIPGLDSVTYRLFEVENSDVIFVCALMEGKVNVVARSRNSNARVNETLRILGGRGHEKAASAMVKNKSISEVVDIILQQLGNINPGLMARDIMSTPVKTVPTHFTMEEAGRIMLRYGHTGMPVVEGQTMVGVISRRDVDKANLHNLGHAPVKGFMTTNILRTAPDTPVGEVQKIMVDNDIGRLPVVDKGRLVGIVSRTDILRTLHGDDYPEDYEVLYSLEGEELNCLSMMEERLPAKILAILRLAGQIADHLGSTVYCVGGFIRDFLLQVPNFDLDLVVEGNGEELAADLAARLGGKQRTHERFRTAVVTLPDGTKIDVATARTEYYEFPAALPRVEKSSIREDLYRRDFTINTLAIYLNPDRFGDLIDYFGGRRDLEKGIIRILYNLSFVEDPTRILRAIRFEQRYSFTIEADTLRFAIDAIERRMLGKLSYKRILHELILILSEKDPGNSLDRMKEIGLWQYILPEVKLEHLNRVTLKRISIVVTWLEERYYPANVKSWLVYILVLLARLNNDELEGVLVRYPFDNYAIRAIRESRPVPATAEFFTQNDHLEPHRIDKMIGEWTRENLVYLLLLVREESAWNNLVNYLDRKEWVQIEINGNDLKEMNIKEGPVYRRIFDKLYRLKLDGLIHNREDELVQVKKWMEEGEFADPMVD
jgi:tRNA nucleotidyltransferase (CCA-adding enzyme)